MYLNNLGNIVTSCWEALERHYNNVGVDAFVVMPHYIHGVIMLKDMNLARSNVEAGLKPAPMR